MSRPRPHCFTIRELLIVVAEVKEEEQRVAYVEKVFGWFFERTRSVEIAVGGVIGIAVLGAFARKEFRITVIAFAVCLIGAVVWINSVLSPLHREYIECLKLLSRIGGFRKELRASCDSERGWPESEVFLRWVLRLRWSVPWAFPRVLHDKWKVTPGEAPTQAIGRFLVENLAGIPIDLYERNPCVRGAVNNWLDRAGEAKEQRINGSEDWKRILEN